MALNTVEIGAPVSQIAQTIFGLPVPHADALGLVVEGYAPPKMTVRLPFQACLVGNPEGGILHGGGLSTLADTACGFLAMALLDPPQPVATLDLRMDYLRPAFSADVLCEADAYRIARSMVFVRGRLWQESEEGPRDVAAAAGSFMITGQEIGRGLSPDSGPTEGSP